MSAKKQSLSANTSTPVLETCLKGNLTSVKSYQCFNRDPLLVQGSKIECYVISNTCVFLYFVRYLDKLGRHNYVTPTSYLELISSLKTLLGKKQDEVCMFVCLCVSFLVRYIKCLVASLHVHFIFFSFCHITCQIHHSCFMSMFSILLTKMIRLDALV